MAYSNLEERGGISGLSMAADANGTPLDARGVVRGSVQYVWSGASATNATIKLQQSNNGTNWHDISGSSVTVAAASGAGLVEMSGITTALIRAVFTRNAETTGTITAHFMLKGR